MQVYVAHYISPIRGESATGVFEFKSSARAGSKQNLQDARMKMLQEYGKEAVSWVIDSVERKTQSDIRLDHQLEFDFREQPAQRKRRNKGYW